ncbi:4-alpha-glucanotransferase [Chloroherpeton thalassium ATCC 35110]|uniref:4-alpha-glucanotransferase n=1 Tax=Chloroherpeton thalassium (strain ATCC 35110 / GB-78) TaxID=517418 RepID=B3QX98_CHLT3|nr:alpha-amylase/4-alpha-glucanotransferase domain-containing protein [Chloroherpeton thalassium]ACF13372.1 4-alpha-glucanotransferase [Chloroherpeton thalassium ATCC 35110]
MKTINLILGTHNHQPVGNFDFVFEDSYNRSYKPFLDVYENFPDIKIVQHYTGILYEWILKNRPEFFEELKKLVERGSMEMMSGGFYEPILAVIPDEDKTGQIQKLTKFIKKHFDYDAKGLWLAERIWEQHLVKPLHQAGIEYVVLDDTHFKYAGLTDEQLLGYYITEEQGFTTHLFPISKQLRYTIPFQDVAVTLDYLRELATEEGDRIVVFADDGEKFGAWPGTYEHVYGKNQWLEKFFQALRDNSDWIRTMTFKEAVEKFEPLGRIYLTNSSYAEMMHWALPSKKAYRAYEDFEQKLKDAHLYNEYEYFVRGGFWRNFMVKYPESNQMHKRMLEISTRARDLQEKGKKVKPETIDKIWEAQCNCPYWHGVFGGTYLPNLRHPIFTALIEADVALDKIDNKDGNVGVVTTDFDKDGKPEIILKSNELSLYLKPSEGGKLIELDYKRARKNILDIFTRQEEGYHNKIRSEPDGAMSLPHFKEAGLETHLNYDRYRRGSFIEHFLPMETSVEELYHGAQRELSDFHLTPFAFKTKGTKAKQKVTFTKTGNVHVEGANLPVELTKAITLEQGKSEFQVQYELKALEKSLKVMFAVENCYGLLAGDAPDRYYYVPGIELEDAKLRSMGEVRSAVIGLKDEWLNIDARLEASQEARIVRYPIETISLSEAGFERVYQASAVFFCFELTLTEKPLKLNFTQSFKGV